MHPHTFYSTLFEPSKREEVFVIMSFAPEFDARWRNVIEPTIREQLKLKANRVDYNVSGESVVYDILDGIAHARLVIADITSTRMHDAAGQVWPQRNGNVMWEVGIAHVTRMPDEVILIRSDTDPSIFDLTQFRAFRYDPTDEPVARERLTTLARDRLRSIDRTKSEYVARCADALDPFSAHFLLSEVPFDGREFQITTSMMNGVMVPRLFELGILRAVNYSIRSGSEADKVTIVGPAVLTPFGRVVLELWTKRMGVWDQVMANQANFTIDV